jgi:tRNA (guanine37-N1)-methyltransferase
MFPGPLGASLAGRALAEAKWSLDVRNIRDHATDKHRTVDDTPAGGGPGMVLRADILAAAIDAANPKGDERPVWLMSPRGEAFDQSMARELASGPGVILIAGRFEGVDQRVIDARSLREVSIGDYVLSGGEIAAMAILDAAIRLLPNVLGNPASIESESFADGLLEYPHYTRPTMFEGRAIPDVLLSGNHEEIAKWRRQQSLQLTRSRRLDLFDKS